MEVRSKITIRKEASNWKFTIFLDKPVKWTYFWNCKLISHNEYNTVSSPTTIPPLHFRDLDFTQKDWEDGNINLRVVVTISKEANNWTYTMFFTKPVNIKTYWGCKVISANEYKTVSQISLLPHDHIWAFNLAMIAFLQVMFLVSGSLILAI